MEWVLLALLLFLALSAAGIGIVNAVLLRLPATYFSLSRTGGVGTNTHPVLRWTGLIIKNIIGVVVVAIGIVLTMPGVPGPGILTILLGIMLMDFPGKRRLERWLIRRPKVLAAVNRLRQQHGKAPFVLDDVSQ